MSVKAGLAVGGCLFSRAHCCTAPSIWRRLSMHVAFCDCVRARTQLGMARAANMAISAVTIMISSNVKPERGEVLFFIQTLCNSCVSGAIKHQVRHAHYVLIACCNRGSQIEAFRVPVDCRLGEFRMVSNPCHYPHLPEE